MRKTTAATVFVVVSLVLATLLITSVLQFTSASLIFAATLVILGISSHGFTRTD